jgi:hypothetical protein
MAPLSASAARSQRLIPNMLSRFAVVGPAIVVRRHIVIRNSSFHLDGVDRSLARRNVTRIR